jgi:hypothetical protein
MLYSYEQFDDHASAEVDTWIFFFYYFFKLNGECQSKQGKITGAIYII